MKEARERIRMRRNAEEEQQRTPRVGTKILDEVSGVDNDYSEGIISSIDGDTVTVKNTTNTSIRRRYRLSDLTELKNPATGESTGVFIGKELVGGKRTKKKKVSKKKKSIIKKVGVYRTKGGYFYRRYKNGKVKRISKETYQKSKKK